MKKICLVLALLLALSSLSASALNAQRFDAVAGNVVSENSVLYGFDSDAGADKLRMAYVDLGGDALPCPVMIVYWEGENMKPDSMTVHAGEKTYKLEASENLVQLDAGLQVENSFAFAVDAAAAEMLNDVISDASAQIYLQNGDAAVEFVLTEQQRSQLKHIVDEYNEAVAPMLSENSLMRLCEAALKADISAAAREETIVEVEDPEYPTLQIGSKGEAVQKLQEYLIALGYLKDSADGDYGKKTAAAVSAFQASQGMAETGIADGATQRRLFAMELPKQLDVKIKSVKLRVNSAGTTELYVRFQNTGSVTIDRIDFTVRCYDAYGDRIYGYDYYSEQDNYYDSDLKPGSTTPSDWRWGLYGFDGTQKVEIAITRYHMTDGTSVSVSYSDRVWHSFG